MAEPIVISIDAMGGDNAPEAVIEGVKLASEKQENVFFFGTAIFLLFLS